MNLMIFGGEGFIGKHLVDCVSGPKVGLDKNKIYSLDIVDQNPFTVFCDVRKPINLDFESENPSIIFNLAAVHKTPGHPDDEYFETNIKGAENICNFARQKAVQTIVFTSSIAPYGASEGLKNEETLATPNTPYGISKLVAEHIHRTWQAEDSKNRKLIIVRPGVVFGKNEGGNFSRLYNALSKGFFFYPGRKDTLKASVYVKDVCRILYDTAIYEPAGVSLFNLTYDPPPSIKRICETISEVTNVRKPKLLVPGILLKGAAKSVSVLGTGSGERFSGIHPDRIKKLLVSTNISGSKLSNSRYKLKYPLDEAIVDWFNDCENKGLF